MPLPAGLTRFNKRIGNRAVGLVAGRVPGYGIVAHRGRRTGRTYRTPVSVFTTDDGVIVPLFYGRDRDWVKNVLAAGGCRIRSRGRTRAFVDPAIVDDVERRDVPPHLRPVLTVLGVREFLHLSARQG